MQNILLDIFTFGIQLAIYSMVLFPAVTFYDILSGLDFCEDETFGCTSHKRVA